MADNINISPEMINNLMNMLKNNNNPDINSTTDNTNPDSSKTTDSSVDFSNLQNLLSNFTSGANTNTNNNESHSNSESNNTSSIDFETIMKIKSIIETMNTKNDPRSNLLNSLKPYLRENKRSKLDQYANLLKITQVADLFRNEKEK